MTLIQKTFILYSCSTQSVLGYWGRLSWYFLSRPGGTKRPPRKWYRPLNKEADFLGAVREMSMSGCSPSALPSSTSQPSNKQTNKKSKYSPGFLVYTTVEVMTIRSMAGLHEESEGSHRILLLKERAKLKCSQSLSFFKRYFWAFVPQ